MGSRFIEITDTIKREGLSSKITISIDQIECYRPASNDTCVLTVSGWHLLVEETYEEVTQLIKEEETNDG